MRPYRSYDSWRDEQGMKSNETIVTVALLALVVGALILFFEYVSFDDVFAFLSKLWNGG